MKDDRFQFQPLYIKIFRWLKHKPVYSIKAVKMYFWYLLHPKAKKTDTENGTFPLWNMCWGISMGMADFKMKHYYI